MRIRDAVQADFDEITAIYNEVLTNSTAIYNDRPTTVEERIAWWQTRREQGYPVLVASDADSIAGFATFGDFRPWPGYRFTIEGTIHIHSSTRGQGVGTELLKALVAHAAALGKHTMIAGVDSENTASLRFLERFGFERAALLREVGYKFDRFLNLILLQYWITPPTELSVARFEAAADAIVSGDIATLKRLLQQDPELIRARSQREHGATLLHYVAANGVEQHRQTTPKNIVEITRLLLQAGAEVDAPANMYGGGCTALGLAATSGHPERAGVRETLLQTLLDSGANIDGLSSAGNKHSIVTACLANGRSQAAEFLAGRVAHLNLAEAAGLGRLDAVAAFFSKNAAGAPPEQFTQAFLFACQYGRNSVVEFLIGEGVDLATHAADGQTGLHWAVIGGHPDTVRLLLKHRPPLEAENIYGGAVFGQALWSAAHDGDPDSYIAILDLLSAAGAKIPAHCPPVSAGVDAWLRGHGCQIGM